jgi:molybdopterin-binding protein
VPRSVQSAIEAMPETGTVAPMRAMPLELPPAPVPATRTYAMLRHMARDEGLLLGEAARAIGVSQDTLRRWDRAGKLRTRRDSANRRRVSQREVERLAGHPDRHRAGDGLSARNRFPGVVRSVEVDGVMALVEIEAGPFLVTAAVTRDAVEELGLARGVPVAAAVKATSVMVERNAL